MDVSTAFRALSVRLRVELVLGALAVMVLGWQAHALRVERHRAADLALKVDTLRAHADTTRRLALPSSVMDPTVLSAVQRQTVQATQRADSLDRALRLERIARTVLVARLDSLHVHDTARVIVANATDTATRSATFDGRVDAYTYHAAVTMPAPPASASLALSVVPDSLRLEVRQGCGPANGAGIRSAYATVIGPTGVPLHIERTEQSPVLCQSPALAPSFGANGRSLFRRLIGAAVARVGVSVGYGAALASDGRIARGPALVAGVKLWP